MIFFRRKKIPLSSLPFTFDCHCHLLPGVDDGSQHAEESIDILRMMAASGVRKVTLTPHINPDIFKSDELSTIDRYFNFYGRIPKEIKEAITITIGAEYMVIPGFEEKDPLNMLKFTEGKILIEMSYYFPSNNIGDAIFRITSSGMTPVIAHPERYIYHADDLEQFDALHDLGCEFQLNLLSTGGAYGEGSMKIMKYLMKKDWYTYVGSDTHTLAHFRKIMSLDIDRDIADNVAAILQKNQPD